MVFDFEIFTRLAAPALAALLGGLLKYYLEGRSKLTVYLGHASTHPLPNDQGNNLPMTVHTHSIVVRNTGKKSANNVRIGHAVFPESYQIFPAISHSISDGQGQSKEIIIPIMVPNEQITISYLYHSGIFWNQISSYVKSDEGMAKEISLTPSVPLSKFVAAILWLFVFVGLSTILYWSIFLIRYLVSH